MRLPRYAQYKNSGVEWLGDVPQPWQVVAAKRMFEVVGGSTPAADEVYWGGGIPWATPADLGDDPRTRLQDTQRTITQAGLESCAAKLVPAGSIIVSTRAPIGSLALAGCELATNQGCRALVARGEVSPAYYAYVLSIAGADLNARGKGSTFLELSGSELARFPLPQPSYEEQVDIVAFLNRELAALDGLIAEQKRLTVLLKAKLQAMIARAVTKGLDPEGTKKPSGVEWLGDVPAHWCVTPLGHKYEIQLGKMLDTGRITGENLRPYLRVADVQWDQIDAEELPVMDFNEADRQKFRLRAGDLLVNEGGSYVGRSAIWNAPIHECYYQKALHRVRPKCAHNDHTRFLYYMMNYATHIGVFVAGGNQNTVDHLPAEKLAKYRFAFPPANEQREIAKHLDEQTAAACHLIGHVERAIALLLERRSALISAAVTGKIDVRSLAKTDAT